MYIAQVVSQSVPTVRDRRHYGTNNGYWPFAHGPEGMTSWREVISIKSLGTVPFFTFLPYVHQFPFVQKQKVKKLFLISGTEGVHTELCDQHNEVHHYFKRLALSLAE